jgi:hypothetical protein
MILSKIQTSLGKSSEKVFKVFNRLSLSGGWPKLALLQNLGCGSAGAACPDKIGMPMCVWLKLFFKMCGGKNFKNIRNVLFYISLRLFLLFFCFSNSFL